MDKLIQIGIVELIQMHEYCYVKKWKSKLAFLHPQRHIPPTNPNYDINMSPVEGYTFANCLSMQNIQILTQCGGVNKYVCKYIGKVDEQNYVIVQANNAHGNGSFSLSTKTTFLHNTKVSSLKFQEDKNRKKHNNKPQAQYISHMEQLSQMLRYAEVTTDLRFVNIPTMPLEYHTGIELDYFALSPDNDSAQAGSISNDIRSTKVGLQM